MATNSRTSNRTPNTPRAMLPGLAGIGGQNLLDKAIAYVAPGFAAQRMAARTTLAMGGGYTGARIDKAQLSRWSTQPGSATSDVVADLRTLRARSSDQLRNSAIAVGAINQTVNGVVGTGLSFTAQVDAGFLGMTEEQAQAWNEDHDRRFAAWCKSPDCTLERNLNFYAFQELAFRSELERGDVFVLTPLVDRPGQLGALVLQLIEADRVCNPNHTHNTIDQIEGIDLDPTTREPIRIHVTAMHPADALGKSNTWKAVPLRGASGRRNVLHSFQPLRPGQLRGVPWIAPILEPLKQLGRWTETELNTAINKSLLSVFIRMDPEAFQDLFDGEASAKVVEKGLSWSGEMDSGKVINLLPGEEPISVSAAGPSPDFDPFWMAMVRQIGMALEIPVEVLIMHFQSSYTAARGAMLMAAKFWRRRRDRLVTNLCDPVHELWLAEEITAGRITAPGFFSDSIVRAAWCAGVWTGDGPGSLDPLKEVAAARERVEMEISTLDAESVAFDGINWKVKHQQRAKEVAAQKRDGTYVPKAGAAAASDADTSDTPPPPQPGDNNGPRGA
jgi:lambda family phage portal protein